MSPRALRRRLAGVVADRGALAQSATALALASLGSLVAGLTLGAITHTLEELPGLLLLVPAAIGMRGNVFGALGSRLGTTIHMGTFTVTRRVDTVVGQNVVAAIALSVVVSLALAVIAKLAAIAFHVGGAMSLADFVVISVVGGVLSSVVVLAVTVTVAAQSAHRGWDLDNVAAPMVTAAGDMVTLPALWAASHLAGIATVTLLVGGAVAAGCALVAVAVARSGLGLLRTIVRESLPVLVLAAGVDVVAGVTIETRLETSFAALPAILVLIPPFLEDCGALGGILAARLATKLHLGTIEPVGVPQRAARDDIALTFLYAVPLFALVAVTAHLAATVTGLATPGLGKMVATSLLGGLVATTFAVVVAYWGGIAAHRLGLDPDNHGIPLVTSTMDLVGALSLVVALVALGVV